MTSNSLLKKKISRQYHLVPDLREKAFSSSLLSMMLAVGLSYTAFIMLKYIPAIPTLLSFFF